jgi:hypothetical protein
MHFVAFLALPARFWKRNYLLRSGPFCIETVKYQGMATLCMATLFLPDAASRTVTRQGASRSQE